MNNTDDTPIGMRLREWSTPPFHQEGEDKHEPESVMIDLPKIARRFLGIGITLAMAAGVTAHMFDRNIFVVWATLLLAISLSIGLLVLLWRLPWGRGLLFTQIGFFAIWTAYGTGWILAKGELDDDVYIVVIGIWLIIAAIGGLLTLWPRRRILPEDPNASIPRYTTFHLRDLLIGIAILSALFAIGRIDHGPREQHWTWMHDFGRSQEYYQEVATALDSWILDHGYELSSSVSTPLQQGGEHTRICYQKIISEDTVVRIQVGYQHADFTASLETSLPKRAIATETPQEAEAWKMRRDFYIWWDEYVKNK